MGIPTDKIEEILNTIDTYKGKIEKIRVTYIDKINKKLEKLEEILNSALTRSRVWIEMQVKKITKSIQDTKRIIKDYSYQYIEANNKECAFIEYLEQIDYLRDIPDRFINYIDYEKLMRDFEIEGLHIEEVNFNNYLFIY